MDLARHVVEAVIREGPSRRATYARVSVWLLIRVSTIRCNAESA